MFLKARQTLTLEVAFPLKITGIMAVPHRLWVRSGVKIKGRESEPKAWSRMHRFGYGWRVEGAFSCIKRVFGEYVSARKFVKMARETLLKASI